MERRLAAILAADVVGYSRLMGEDEAGTLVALKTHREELINLKIAEHSGRIVKLMGDGALVEFASVVDAVHCAVSIQQAMVDRSAGVPKTKRIRFRIGINLGDMIVEGDDLYGDGVNIAARLESLAEPGGICVSRTVFNHVKNKVALDFEDLGDHKVKNIAEPVRVYKIQLGHDDRSGNDSVPMAEQSLASDDPVATALNRGRDALSRHDWVDAFTCYCEADKAGTLSPEDLESLSEAAWWCSHIDDFVNALERAYARYLEQGNQRRAAALCMLLAESSFHRLASSVANGWLRRAERLLDAEPECPEHGYFARFQARVAFEGEGELERAAELAENAWEIAGRFGDRDLQMLALHDRGCILLASGRVQDGMSLMEEALAATLAGELSAMTTGRIHCNMIEICEKLADYQRAGEWDEEAKRWCDRVGHHSGFPGICRVKRAKLSRLRGAWAEAEQEARKACDELADFLDFSAVAIYEIGEVRLHMGDLTGAEEAFRQAHQLGQDPEPGLALLRLAQGNVVAARNFIERSMIDDNLTSLDRAHLLPAQIEISLAMKDMDAARSQVEELQAIAGKFGSKALEAAAACGQGRLHFCEDHLEEAADDLRRSCKLWRESGLVYDEARSRLMLGTVYRAQGAEDLCDLELESAKAVFERLGATLDLVRATELLKSVANPCSPEP